MSCEDKSLKGDSVVDGLWIETSAGLSGEVGAGDGALEFWAAF